VEAIVYYQAGAFKAAIEATWIAMVFDLLATFRESKLTGDNNASK
jgi:hypothetical protein